MVSGRVLKARQCQQVHQETPYLAILFLETDFTDALRASKETATTPRPSKLCDYITKINIMSHYDKKKYPVDEKCSIYFMTIK